MFQNNPMDQDETMSASANYSDSDETVPFDNASDDSSVVLLNARHNTGCFDVASQPNSR